MASFRLRKGPGSTLRGGDALRDAPALLGSATGVATATGGVKVSRRLAGSATGGAVATGGVAVARRLGGSGAGVGAVTGALTVFHIVSVPPNTVLAATNFPSTTTNIRDDPDSPDVNWNDAPTATANVDVRWSWDEPSSGAALTAGANMQEWRIRVRVST